MNKIDTTKYLRQMKYLPDITSVCNIFLIVMVAMLTPFLTTIYYYLPSVADPPKTNYAHYEPSYTASVDIKKSGKIFITGREIENLSKIKGLLADKMDELQSKRLRIFADAEAPWGKIIDVMQAAKKAGVKAVGFMMEGEYSVLHYWDTKNRYREKGLKYPEVGR